MWFSKPTSIEETGNQEQSKERQKSDNASFDSIIEQFEQAPFEIKTKIPILRRLKNTLDKKNVVWVNDILIKLSVAEKYDEINTYIDELQAIAKKYEDDKKLTSNEGVEGRWRLSKENQERWILDSIKWWFFSEIELAEIESINIDWEFENFEDFQNRFNILIKYIKKTDTFKNLSPNEKEAFLNNLNWLVDFARKANDKNYEFVEKKFDDYAKQIESQKEWQVVLNIWNWETIEFSSKKEAFEYINALKKEAEVVFRDGFRNALGMAWWGVLYILSTWFDILTKPYQWWWWFIKDSIIDDDFNRNATGIEWAIDIIWSTLAAIMILNYSETLWRRIVIDTLAKQGRKYFWTEIIRDADWRIIMEDIQRGTRTIKRPKKWWRRILIPDYWTKRENNPQFMPTAEEAWLYNEYLQRISIIEQLEEQYRNIPDKDKLLFKKRLEKIKTLLNVNTKSFYLEAYALKNGLWNPRKYWWSLRSWVLSFKLYGNVFPWFSRDLSQEAATEFNTNKWELIRNLNEWLWFVFKSATVKINQYWNIEWVDWNTEVSDNIQKIQNAILVNDKISEEEKQKRIKRINDFINELKIRPRWEQFIKEKLYNIAEKGELSKSQAKAIVEDALKYYKPSPFNQSSDIFDNIKNIPSYLKEQIIDKASKILWDKAPTVLTKWQATLIKLQMFIESDLWQWNETQLNDLINDIESWKIEFNRLYPGMWWKISATIDFAKWLWLYFLNWTPIELSQTKRFRDSVLESDIQDLLKKWENLQKARDLMTWNNGSNLIRNLENIFNLDSRRFPPDIEYSFEEILKIMKERFDNYQLYYTEEQLKIEIAKMNLKYIPKFAIIDIVKWKNNYWINIDLNWLKLENKNVKQFIELVEKWEWNWTIEELKDVIKRLKNGETINKKELNINTERVLRYIQKKWLELEKNSFRREKFGIPFVWDKLDTDTINANEVKLAELFHNFSWNNFENKINDLYESVNDKNIDYQSQEFFSELKNKLSLPDDIFIIDEDTTREIFRKEIANKIEKDIKELLKDINNKNTPFDERIEKMKQLKEKLWISIWDKESIFIISLRNAWINTWLIIDEISRFEADEIKLWEIATQKNELISRINDVDSIDNLAELKKHKEAFNKYISDNWIDRMSDEYKDLIKDFYDKYNAKESSLKVDTTWTTETLTPQEKLEKQSIIRNYYIRAIIEAELIWKYDIATDLNTEMNSLLTSNDTIFWLDLTLLESHLETDLKSKLLLTSTENIRSYDELINLKRELYKALDDLVDQDILKKSGNMYKLKKGKTLNSIDFSKFDTDIVWYIRKAIKSWS